MKRFMLLVVAVLLGFMAANAQGTGPVVVADSTATNTYVPIYGLYTDNYLRCQTIYPESMLTGLVGKEIKGVNYYLSTSTAHEFTSTFEIHIGTCSASSFETASFDSTTHLTTVYTGGLSHSGGVMTVLFDTPFTYTGGNLLIEVTCPTHTSDYASTSFYGMNRDHQSVQGYSSNSVAAVSATYRNFIPKTAFLTCLAPTFGTVAVELTSAQISWTDPNGATSWSMKVNDGEWTTVTTNPYTLDGLTSNTAYTVSLRSMCSGEDVSLEATTTFRTACGAQTMPYEETFEGQTAGVGNLAACWTEAEGGASYVQGSRGFNSDKAFNLRGPAMVASPVITVGGQNVYINFDLKRQSDMSGTMAVGLATSPEMMEMAMYFDTIEPTDNDYHNYEFEFNNTLNIQSGCLVFKQIAEETTVSYWLDNVNVRVLTDCKRPAEGEIADVTPRSATVNWATASAATAYELAYGESNNVEEADSIITVTGTTKTIEGLVPETQYYAWVRTVCGEERTMWRYLGTFTTEVPCLDVVNAEVATTTTNAIALNWTIDTTEGYASTMVQVGYKTSDATEWTYTTTTNNYFMLTGLEGGVTYNFRIRNICGNDSADVIALTASTKVCGEVAGATTTSSYIPTYSYYSYSYTQAVYTSAEVGDIETITGIQYKNNSTNTGTRTIDVYMANVENASLSSGYLDISDFTQVATGYEWTIASGWSEIVFDEPFVHQAGHDIVVAVADNTGEYLDDYPYFSAHSGSSRYVYNDYDAYDPSEPPSGYSSSNVPDVRFTTICNTECEAPLAVVSNVDAHSVTVMWTPMGSESSWTVGYKASGESEWTTVSNNVTAHEYTVSGLNAGTNYQIRIGANCDGDTSYANLSLFTDCDVMEVPYTENFNGSVLNPCWAFSSTYPTLSNGRLYNGYSSNTNYAILPQFSAAINTLRINFDAEYTGYSTNGKLQIGVVSNQDGIETFTMVDSVVVSSTASHYEVLLNNYSGTGSYIAIKFMTTYVYVDNVVVDEIPNCVHPTAMTLVNAGENSMTLQWTENGSATQWVMKVDDGAWTTVTNPYTINGLSANTVYTVSVASLCGGDTSEVESGTFRTACGMESLPYMEGFESYDEDSFPACWTSVSGTNKVVSTYASDGTNSLRFAQSGIVTTPVINVGGNNLNITFDLRQEDEEYSGTMAVGYAASPESAATSAVYLDTITPEEEDEWISYEYTFENTMNIQTGCIVFKQIKTSTYDYWYWLDNVTVSVLTDCQRPDSGSVTNVTPVAATATWSAVAGASGYEVAYGTSGEVSQALETLPASGTTLTLTNLTPNTTYYAWVRTVCGTEQALWRSLGSFTTQPACAQVENARVTNADVTELTIGWRLNEEVGYASTAVRVMYKKATGQTWNDANDTTVTGTTLTLTGLEAGKTYNFRIFNICSEDTASMVTLNGTTDVACAAVVDAQVLSTAMTALAIGWTIDSEVGYASTAVLVKYKEAEATEWTDTVVTGTNLILTGLTSGTTYNFSIRNICSTDTSTAVTVNASTSSCGEIGNGSTTISSIPVNVYYMYSYSQAIYTDAEVGNIDTIHGISYNYNGTNNPTRTIDVYIADVENASLANGCLDISQFTQVATNYSWSLSNGWNQIVFSEPFVHQSGKDIVIAVDDNTGVDNGSNYFKGHAGSGYSYYQDSAGDIDPTSPSATNSGARTTVADIRFDVTCNVTCPAPMLVVDEVGSHDVALNWTSLGEETSWTVEYKKASDTVWTVFNDNMTTTSCTIENLEAATGYQFKVGANCTEETAFASVSVTTECAAYEVTLTQDYTQDFNNVPMCWSTENNSWYLSSTGGHNGGFVYTYSDDVLVSPQFDCSTLTLGAQLRFWYKLPSDGGDYSTLKLNYRTSEDGEWTAIESASYTTAVESWTEVEVLLPNSENAAYYQIGFEAEYGNYVYLDDVVVEAAPTCPRPSEFTLGAVTENSATISWASEATLYEVKYRTLGGAWTEVSPAPMTSSVTLTGLESSMAYELSVRAICAAGDTSRVATYAFMTECGVIASTSLPYLEGFEAGIGCWEQEQIEGDLEWETESSYYTALEGSKLLYVLGEDSELETRIISPVFDLTGMENVKLTFAHMQRDWVGDLDNLGVEYRLSPTDEWQQLARYNDIIDSWQIDTVIIPQVSATVQIAFHAYIEYGYGVGIDSLSITGDAPVAPTCDVPTNVTTSNLTANTVTVTWTGSAAQYEVEIIGGGQTISETVNTNSFTVDTLTQETPYTVRVRALCENGLTSDWSAVTNFTTPQPECGVPTNVQTTTTATSVIITWTGYASEYDVKVTGSEIAPINRTVNTNSCTIGGLVPASTYQVIVRAKCNGQYTDWTEPITFYTADGEGIENAEGDFSVSMFPNPAKEQVSIRIDGVSGKVNVALIDMSGRTVMSDTMENGEAMLNVSTLAKGTYFVRLNGEEISTVRKLVVQ